MNASTSAVCPLCGQAVVNRDEVLRLQRKLANQQRRQRSEIAAAVMAEAKQQVAEERASAEQRLAAERARLTHAAKEKDKLLQARENALKQVQEENGRLERRLDKLNAHERGDFNERDIHNQLVHAFPGDKIERLGKGADIVHVVYYLLGNTLQRAGVIAYECKDTIRWEKGFVQQMQKAGVAQGTAYLILVTRALPPGEKTVCVQGGVIIVQPANLLSIANIVRGMVIGSHRAGHPAGGRDEKTERLFDYLTSDEFRRSFEPILRASDELRSQLADEKRRHERDWTRRERAYDELGRKSSIVDEAIRAIIEGSPQKGGQVIRLPDRAKAG